MVGLELSIVLAGLLSLVHYYNHDIKTWLGRHHVNVASFGSGISIAYIFLRILPELYAGVSAISNALFLFVLGGFTIQHIIEKHVYQHESGPKRLKELKEAHAAAFFAYHVIVGVLIVEVLNQSLVQGLTFYLPIFIFAVVSSLALSKIHTDVSTDKLVRKLLSLSSLIGVFIASVFKLPESWFFALFGLIAGTLLYVVIREVLPSEKQGKVSYFLLGITLYVMLIFGLGLF